MYDVLTFRYEWNKARISEPQGWNCFDGYISKNGQIPNLATDTATVDVGQDCVVDDSNSTVVLKDNGFTDFTVRFRRKLITRGLIDDAQLKIDDQVKLEYAVSLTNGRSPLKDSFDPF